MLVRISKDWDDLDIMRQTPNFSKKWGDIEFTTDDVKECDLLVVLNRPHKDIKVKARQAWLFTQEPAVYVYTWHTESFKYFDKIFSFWDKKYNKNIISTQTALPWHIKKSYDELKVMDVNSQKQNRVSWITSSSTFHNGHKKRMEFKEFLCRNKFDFDLYGRGFEPIDDKFDALYPYKYSLAIENNSLDDYWTEKISDCFLSYTMPIYYGAKRITEYFPNESMILIDIENPQEAMEIINNAIENNLWEKNLEYIKESRKLVLEKYQMFPWVAHLVEKYDIKSKKIKHYFIPSNTSEHPKSFKQKFKEEKKVLKVKIRNFINA